MKDKIIVVFSSHLSERENNNFKSHISETIGCKHDIHCHINKNQHSLSKVYNRSLEELKDEKNIVFVFVHNDVIFKTKKWGKVLLRKFNNHHQGIIGLAGTTHLSDTGVWWTKKECMFGRVQHTDGFMDWVSDYGSDFKGLKNVIVVDGLFIAVNPDKIIHGFDEDFPGFHYYDLGFCFNNYIDGCDIGVTNEILVLHRSIGMVNGDWEKNRQLFVSKYSNYLPLDIIK